MTSSSLGTSGLYMTQSASRASTSSMLEVAVTPSVSGAEDVADVAPVLVRAVHPAPDQLQLRMIEHAFDGGLADASGRPLNDTKLGRTTHL